MSKIFSKKLPTILGFLFLLAGIGAGVFFLNKNQFFKTKPEVSKNVIPQEIHISNVEDEQFTVSWITEEKTTGLVKYGVNNSIEEVVLDDRDQRSGETGEYKTHYVTIKNLEPEKTYYFKIGSGLNGGREENLYDNNGQAYSVITGSLLSVSGETKILSGKILNPDKTAAKEIIVYLSATNMAPLSVLTDKNGRWAIFINKARTQDLSEGAVFDLEATVLQVKAQNGEEEAMAVILTKDAFPAVPDLILGHELYDFRDGQAPDQMVVETPGGQVEVTIDNPAAAGERINTFKPQFRGQGPANTVLTIKIESPETYTGTVTVDEKGNWTFTPSFDLSSGDHTVFVSYTDEDGETETISRNFLVLAAGESDLPAITATPSGDLEPSFSPSASASLSPSPSASEPPRVTIPSTDEGVPNTGISWPTILLGLIGVLMVIFGLNLPARFS